MQNANLSLLSVLANQGPLKELAQRLTVKTRTAISGPSGIGGAQQKLHEFKSQCPRGNQVFAKILLNGDLSMR